MAKYTGSELRQRMESFCAYQERCTSEVLQKLQLWQSTAEDIESTIEHLREYNFFDDLRFAKSYVSGKFRIKRWGRIKIRMGLREKKIEEALISNAMDEIDEQDYLDAACTLAEIKSSQLKRFDPWQKTVRVKRYLLSRGFEHEVIQAAIKHNESPH